MYISYANLYVNEDKTLIFDLNNYAIYDTTEEFVDRLQQGYCFLNHDEQKMIDDLKQEKAERDLSNDRGITSIKVHVSNCCNLMCKYCYANQGNYGESDSLMSEDTAERVIDFIRMMMQKNKIEMITFFGGEPLLAPNIIDKICGAFCNENLEFHLQTNGTVINEKIIQMIKKYNIKITVSVDGTQEIHDFNRVTKTGKGTYNTVLENITRLEKEGIKVLAIQATLTKEFASKYTKAEIADILYEQFGAPFIKVEYDKNDDSNIDGNLYEIEDYILRILQGRYILDCETHRFFKRMFSKSYNDYFCVAGKEVISISTDGKIFPCQMFIGKEEYCLGEIENYNGKAKGIPKKSLTEKCHDCIAQCYCSTCGGCVKEDKECEQSRKMVENILKRLFEFSTDDRINQLTEGYINLINS